MSRVNAGDNIPDSPEGGVREPPAGEIDLQRLADKVYALMMKELRLERERGARTAGQRRHL